MHILLFYAANVNLKGGVINIQRRVSKEVGVEINAERSI
jgi:hypothetical protein